MIYPQLLLVHDELIVDLFAGGGGASCGIEMATGRQVDVAINHDAAAVSMHEENHPQARCDGEPIVWPKPTHGSGLKPYRSAAECIDWSFPICSIFATPEEAGAWAKACRAAGWKVGTPKRPLAENTLRRIAAGVQAYVLDTGEPYIVGHIAPTMVQAGYGERAGQAPRVLDLHAPLGTIVGGGQKHALVAAFLAKHFTGVTGAALTEPMPTVTTVDHNALVTASLDSQPDRSGTVAAFIQSYYGQGVGQDVRDPLRTATTKDRMGVVTVDLADGPHAITDIAMRMLQPRELYRAQGFPDSYVIDRGADGRTLTKTEQVRMVGNSVCPPLAAALVRANAPALVARDEVAAA